MSDTIYKCRWNGQFLVPVGNWSPAKMADLLDEGELVGVEIHRGRSMKSHKHQFAWIKDAWQSLPEGYADVPWAASPDTLRKRALIATGFHNVTEIDAGSIDAAERIAALMREDGNEAHGYCIVQVSGQVVRRAVAESQSVKSMGNDRFKESKAAVMDYIAKLLDVSRETLEEEERERRE